MPMRDPILVMLGEALDEKQRSPRSQMILLVPFARCVPAGLLVDIEAILSSASELQAFVAAACHTFPFLRC